MRNKKLVLSITIPILILLIAAVILSSMLLFKGNIIVFKVNSSVNTVNKALSLEKTGGTLELKQEDLNGIFDFYLTKSIKNSNIKGIYSNLNNNEIELYIPATYKNISFLLYTRGRLGFQDKKISFEPNSFKVGKLSLPTKFVMEKLQKYLKNENIAIQNNAIFVNSDLIPFDFTSLTIKDNLFEAEIAKVSVPIPTSSPALTPAAIEKPSGASSPSAAVVDQNKALLIKANNQLSGVYSSAGSAAEKQIVASMKSVIGKMINNPSYPYKAEADQTKANYNKLTQSERDDLKNAMMDNMDMQTVKKLKATFGF